MQTRISAFGWGLVLAVVASLPFVAPQVANLASLVRQGGIALLGLAPFGLIFVLTCMPQFLLMWGISARNRVALGISAIVFPIVWLTGLPTEWYNTLTGGVQTAEMIIALMSALVMAGFYVWLVMQANKLKRVKTN